ncbi:putative polyketide synthase [Podospora australis]|uniref:Polyketide synthase n=1 Tax=Podospora australis TaxID=1536484 RepID=A0AAN7ADW4_9PEZI|nr:putative polyketide synthase [Podospora australis]
MVYTTSRSEPIAIVSRACRFAGDATSPSKLWDILANPTDLTKKIPQDRFNVDAFYHTNGEYAGTTDSRYAYFLEQDHRVFDASFFNITPREAEAIDPQQRMLLEVVYEAMETAGYTLQQHAGTKVGVFAGLMTGDYDTLAQRDELHTSQYYATGNARSILSNRLSYFFDFRGPSMTIDTACSSSLVALHQAVLSLRSGECDMACVAGANLILTPEQFIVESNLHMLSPTGHCRMWDEGANGYARGEGVAAMFVRPLSKALAAGDQIEAIIRETGVNSDGRSQGITMPSWRAQSQLIQDTYRRSGLDLSRLEDRPQYFEAHGTGTQAGDPNEARAIEDAFFINKIESAPTLFVGSVKTIIGHTEGAAGLAGLFKVVESMHHETVPPNLHFEKLSPRVAEFYTHLEVPTTGIPWPAVQPGQPKRGSVNSFGFGGTNSHAIVEQYLPQVHDAAPWLPETLIQRPAPRTGPGGSSVCFPLTLSAPSQRSLVEVVRGYLEYFRNNPRAQLAEVAWHTYARRTPFTFRTAVSAIGASDAVERLEALLAEAGRTTSPSIGLRVRADNTPPRILGIFTGQGAQWPTMSRSFFRTNNIFRDTIHNLEATLANCSDPPRWRLSEEIEAIPARSRVHLPSVAQPLSTAIQIAFVNVLYAMDIRFYAVVGHSSGEIAAAYAAGRITADEAILIAHYRGMGIHHAVSLRGADIGGRMIAVGLSREEATDLCAQPEYRNGICVAASNSPNTVTISGDRDMVELLAQRLGTTSTFNRTLAVETAYHSPHMLSTAGPYLKSLQRCNINPSVDGNGTIWVSSVSGTGAPETSALAGEYWRDNMVQPVLFYEAVSTTLAEHGPFDGAIEVGPHPQLRGPVLQTVEQNGASAITYSGLLIRNRDDRLAVSDFLGWYWSRFGMPAERDHIRRFITSATGYATTLFNLWVHNLPSFPWDHTQSHWRESRVSRQYHFKSNAPHELLGVRTRDDNNYQLRWRNILKYENLPWADGHTFQGQALLPAAAYLVMVLDAARAYLAGRPASVVELRDLRFPVGIPLVPESAGVEILFSLTIEQEIRDRVEASFILASAVADGRTEMRNSFSGRLMIHLGTPSPDVLPTRPLSRPETLGADADEFYEMMAETGLLYTGAFRGLQALNRRYDFSSGSLRKRHPEDTTALSISPGTLDSCLQTAFVTISSPGDNAIWTSFLPLRMESVRFNLAICDTTGPDEMLEIDAYMTKATPFTREAPASFTADIEIFNTSGQLEIEVQGLTVGSFSATTPEDDHELYMTTKWELDPDHEIVSTTFQENPPRNPMLFESLVRVVSLYQPAVDEVCLRTYVEQEQSATLVSPRRATSGEAITSPWQNETEESLDEFINSSPYYHALNLVRRLAKNLDARTLPGLVAAAYDDGSYLFGLQNHIANIVRQIAHKYPRLHVLGLTDPEASLSEHILKGLGESFLSFQIGGDPESNLESRINLPGQSKVTVDKIDLATPAGDKVFDLVVVTTSSIAGDSVNTFRQVRQRMRPGGFLLLVNIFNTGTKQRLRQALRSFETGRRTPPPEPQWSDVLDQSGFNLEVNESFYRHYTQNYAPGHSLIVRQAHSREKAVLLHPNRLLAPTAHMTQNLLIVGGKRFWASILCPRLRRLLTPHTATITVAEAFEDMDLDDPAIGAFTGAIFLTDLDDPTVTTMTSKRLEVLQHILPQEMTILWVTRNTRFDDPDCAASLGFTRTMAAEMAGLTLQVLDLETQNVDTALKLIARSFARLTSADILASVEEPAVLWQHECEVHGIEDESYLVPRVVPWKEGNDRVNANRRIVSSNVNTLEKLVTIVPGEFTGIPYETISRTIADNENQRSIRVNYSTANALNLGFGIQGYLCIGRDPVTDTIKVALSKSNASYAPVSLAAVAELDSKRVNQAQFLAVCVRHLVSLTIQRAHEDEDILLINPDRLFEDCAGYVLGDRLRVWSTRTADRPRREVTFLHPEISEREIRSLYPSQRCWLFNLLPESHKLSQRLLNTLPRNCHYRHISDMMVASPDPTTYQRAPLPRVWDSAVPLASIDMMGLAQDHDLGLISVPDLVSEREPVEPFALVDWKAKRDVPCVAKHLGGTDLLRPDRTYCLLGLTRDFGQSLCTLFVSQGARHIVLASRNPPQVRPEWQEAMIRRGIDIQFESVDVTDATRVLDFKNKLTRTMPPVGGIVNGAMVLNDRIFMNLQMDTLQQVLHPKTIGSKNLDDAFQSPDMDFFIMTSSFAAIGGHEGQSAYAAANMYMNGIAASRRRRGLVGSVLNIGVIYGLGFLHREREELYAGLESEGYPPISERDIHHMFVEAIAAGKPGPDQIYDIVTGLRRFSPNHQTLAWQQDPRFSHYTRDLVAGDAADAAGSGPENYQALIEAATERNAIADIIARAFINRLTTQLNLAEGGATPENSFTELGVDSLASSNLVRWALPLIGHQLPVMQIMDGSTIRQVAEGAAVTIMNSRGSTAMRVFLKGVIPHEVRYITRYIGSRETESQDPGIPHIRPLVGPGRPGSSRSTEKFHWGIRTYGYA